MMAMLEISRYRPTESMRLDEVEACFSPARIIPSPPRRTSPFGRTAPQAAAGDGASGPP